jgi:hypothetical protein
MPGRHWTSVQVSELVRLTDEGFDPRDGEINIAEKTRNAIIQKALRLGLIPLRYEKRDPWPLRQRRRLKKAKRNGLTPEEVCKCGLLGTPLRSLWAIKKQWGRMKLSDKKLRRAFSKKRTWKQAERVEFLSFLREHSTTLHPDEIAKMWRVKASTVRSNQIALGVAPGRAAVLAMDYSKRKRSRSTRKAMLKQWQERRKLRIKELEARASEMRAKPSPRPEQTCKRCNRSWPKHSEFFPTTKKRYRDTTMTSMHHLRTCRLCYGSK